MAALVSLSLAQELVESLSTSVRTTVNTYTHKMETFGGPKVDDCQKLEDFLKMKKVISSSHDASDIATASGSTDCSEHLVEYDMISIVDSQGREIDYACYLLLPGGLCYGPRNGPTERTTMQQMHESAAEVALMNCIFNECPSRKITPEFIRQASDHADRLHSATRNRLTHYMDGPDGYRCVLEHMLGKTMMEYQELMNTIRLLSWSGYAYDLKARAWCRQDVLDYCSRVKIDEGFRSELTMYVVDKEDECEGFIAGELRQSEQELMEWRVTGRELRYPYEKRRVCQMAMEQLNYGGSEGMYPNDDNF